MVNSEAAECWQYNERGRLTEKDERRIRDGATIMITGTGWRITSVRSRGSR